MERFEGGYKWHNGAMIPFNNIMLEECNKHFEEGKVYILTDMNYSPKKKRTVIQNASLHKYLELVANAMNEAGFDIRKVLSAMKAGFTIACTKENIKETVWRPIQQALLGIDSTTDLDTKQVTEVYENVNRFTSERFGVSVHWPDRYSQSLDDIH